MTEFPRDHRQRRLLPRRLSKRPGKDKRVTGCGFVLVGGQLVETDLLLGGTCATAGLPVACGKKTGGNEL